MSIHRKRIQKANFDHITGFENEADELIQKINSDPEEAHRLEFEK